MLELNGRIMKRMETGDVTEALNELMGGAGHGKSMRECLKLLLSHAGVSHRPASVYKARESRAAKRMCYVFGFVCDGRRYEGYVDRITGEILRYRFCMA